MDDSLSSELKELLADRFEGFELVEFLGISIEAVIEAFEEDILDNLQDVLEEANIEVPDEEGD